MTIVGDRFGFFDRLESGRGKTDGGENGKKRIGIENISYRRQLNYITKRFHPRRFWPRTKRRPFVRNKTIGPDAFSATFDRIRADRIPDRDTRESGKIKNFSILFPPRVFVSEFSRRLFPEKNCTLAALTRYGRKNHSATSNI